MNVEKPPAQTIGVQGITSAESFGGDPPVSEPKRVIAFPGSPMMLLYEGTVHAMKEKGAAVIPTYEQFLLTNMQMGVVVKQYKLPDGRTIPYAPEIHMSEEFKKRLSPAHQNMLTATTIEPLIAPEIKEPALPKVPRGRQAEKKEYPH